MFTKTETARRLRALSADARRYADGRRHRVEIGLRILPQTADTVAQAVDLRYPDGDDLVDYFPLSDAAGEDEVRAHGALVHIYVSSFHGAYGWEVDTVCVGWVGTPDSEPVLLDHDGRLCTGLLEVTA